MSAPRETGTERRPVIGITGGIGAGKSAVARILADLGCVVSHADEEAQVVLDDPRIRETLVSWWGGDILDASGRIDRGAVAAIVFADPEQRRRLEGITHPAIEARRVACFEGAPVDAPALVIDAPLLLEAGLDRTCDVIIFVEATRETRLARVQEGRDWDDAELDRRELSQLPLDEKVAAADYVVRNEGDLSELAAQVSTILSEIEASCST